MTRYALRRLALVLPTLGGVSLLVVAIVRLLPGDAVDALVAERAGGNSGAALAGLVDEALLEVGVDPAAASFEERNAAERALIDDELRRVGSDPEGATSAQRSEARQSLTLRAYEESVRARLGLDRSFAGQWWQWTSSALRGDLGRSLTNDRSVGGEIVRRLPVSLQLGGLSLAFAVAIALPAGVMAAVRRDAWPDHVARVGAVLMLAFPSFFVATVVIALGARWFGYAPPLFYADVWDRPGANLELMLPAASILALTLAGMLLRLTRAQMLDALAQDYVRTARSRGLGERAVVIRHALRNAMLPLVTLIGLQVPILIGGSLVLEQIFGIPGVADYLYGAIGTRDFPVIMAVNMTVATAVVLTNLAVDLAYAWLDPRASLA